MKPAATLCCALLAASTIAQNPPAEEPRGVFHAIPHFLSLETVGAVPELAWKPLGDISPYQPIAAMPVAGAPDLRLSAMFGATAAHIELDAISSGNDDIPVPGPNGELDPDLNGGAGWLAITFSVTPGSTRANSVMDQRPDRAADIYGYFVPGSAITAPTGVASVLVDHVYLEQGHEHMGLPTNEDIDAHDAYLPYVQDGAPAPSPLLLNNTQFFFSLTPASAAAINVNDPLWLGPQLPQSAHAADIYQITWDGTEWSAPVVYRSRTVMGLTAGSNIDALAVRYQPNYTAGEGIVMFSTDIGSPPVPIATGGFAGQGDLIVQGSVSASQPNPPVLQGRDRFGVPIRLVNSGDVDAITVYDPETLTPNHHLAYPIADASLPNPKLGLSLVARVPNAFLVSVSGFAPSDGGTILLQARVGGVVFQVDAFPSTGHTTQRRLDVPVAVGNVAFDVWAEYVPTVPPVRYSWPVRIMVQ